MTKEMEFWFSTWESSEYQLETLRDSLRQLEEENCSLIRINQNLCKAHGEEVTGERVTFGQHIIDLEDGPRITDRDQFERARPLGIEAETRDSEKTLYVIQQEEEVSHNMISDMGSR